MPTIASLKLDLETGKSLGDIIDVLKTAALIQFRSIQSKDRPNEDFLKEADVCFSLLTSKDARHPYLFDRKSLPSAIVIVTSDEGFLGELNTLLINAGVDLHESKNDEIIVLGERGARYLEDMGLKFTFFPGITEEISYKDIIQICRHILKGYRKTFGRAFIVYPRYVSLTAQRVERFRMLPYSPSSETAEQHYSSRLLDQFLIEPEVSRVTETLTELWMGYKFSEIFWSSKQSEFAARIMHLEGSTQELIHMNHELSLKYFRQVHLLKDKSIREISASKNILEKR